MIIKPQNRFKVRRRSERGIMLMECLVYMALFAVITGLAASFFLEIWANAKELRSNASAITLALRAGERWRDDVRAAAGPLRAEEYATERLLHIPQKTGEMEYRFAENSIWRRAGADAPWVLLLRGVNTSSMKAAPRDRVTAWRWDLEMAVRHKTGILKPWLAFEAVPSFTKP